MTRQQAAPVLSVRNLSVDARTPEGLKRILDGVSFDLAAGETLCLAGESGSGKSVTSLAIMGLLPRASLKVASGEIRLEDRNILGIPHKALRRIRGGEVAMIFQEPMTSLNPVMTIGDQMVEAIREHREDIPEGAEAIARDMLDAWWISFFPGFAIFLTVLALNLAGEGLNDALNPRLARGRE